MIHLLRYLYGSYVLPRRFNFLIGLASCAHLAVGLHRLCVRWDEGIRWALTVGTACENCPKIGDSLYGFVVAATSQG